MSFFFFRIHECLKNNHSFKKILFHPILSIYCLYLKLQTICLPLLSLLHNSFFPQLIPFRLIQVSNGNYEAEVSEYFLILLQLSLSIAFGVVGISFLLYIYIFCKDLFSKPPWTPYLFISFLLHHLPYLSFLCFPFQKTSKCLLVQGSGFHPLLDM